MVGLLLLLTLQSPGSVQQAAQSITEIDIRRRIGLIADDSMRGRDTPSPELDEVAAYIAGEYKRLGLRPAGDGNGYLQRYSLDRVQIVGDSAAIMMHIAQQLSDSDISDVANYFETLPAETH